MAYNIDELLSLPVRERRKISEKLFSSLPESNSLTEEDKETIKMLDKRWNEIKSGKAKLLTPAQLRAGIKKSRDKKV
jgi:putative addiction module component (TIGR02574 family)